MARKTVALQKRQKKKKKTSSSTTFIASKVESKEKVKDDNTNQEMNIDSSTLNEGLHITTHQNGEECNCFLRRANMFLPANLLGENNSSINNSSKR